MPSEPGEVNIFKLLQFNTEHFRENSRGSQRAVRETAVQPGSESVRHALREVLGKGLCRLPVGCCETMFCQHVEDASTR